MAGERVELVVDEPDHVRVSLSLRPDEARAMGAGLIYFGQENSAN